MTKNILLGVGNDIRRDDAIGELVAREFDAPGWDTEDCGPMPENFVPHLKEGIYEVAVIVDAADMKLEPGQIRQVPREKLGVFTMSTHALPISLVMDFLEEKVDQVVLIGIQPKDMSLGEGMSPELVEAKERLLELLKSGAWKDIPVL